MHVCMYQVMTAELNWCRDMASAINPRRLILREKKIHPIAI